MAISAAIRHNSGMSTANARFPRTAYARRAARLAEDLGFWSGSLKDFARGPDSWMPSVAAVNRAEARAFALDDLVHDLQEIAIRIEAIR